MSILGQISSRDPLKLSGLRFRDLLPGFPLLERRVAVPGGADRSARATFGLGGGLTARVRQWRIAKAVVEGTSHAATGVPCQDYADTHQIETEPGAVLLAVVSDGAGSAAHSDIASWLATKTILELIELHFDQGGSIGTIDRPLAGVWIERVGLEIANDASRHERALRDYACTLLVAIVGESAAAFLRSETGGSLPQGHEKRTGPMCSGLSTASSPIPQTSWSRMVLSRCSSSPRCVSASRSSLFFRRAREPCPS